MTEESREELKRRALLRAGFSHRTARVLAWLDSRLTLFILVVALIAAIAIGFYLWPDLDAAAWQEWADANPAFFEPLQPGDVVGIVPELHQHTGLLVERTSTGVSVDLRLWFPFDEVAVGLVVPPETASAWMELRVEGGQASWGRWRALAREGGIRTYERLDDQADDTGYRRFLARLRGSNGER